MTEISKRSELIDTRPRQAMGLEPYWLPRREGFNAAVKAIDLASEPQTTWPALVALADTRLDFVRTLRLDRSLRRHFGTAPPRDLATRPLRLALLGSSTLGHLAPAIRVAALRRGMWIAIHEAEYGQYQQELADASSPLHGFKPDVVLLAIDAQHLLRAADAAASADDAEAILEESLTHLRGCWQLARDAFQCQIIQQTLLPLFRSLLGSNEQRLPGSRHYLAARLNAALRPAADTAGVDLLSVDSCINRDGIAAWHDPMLWHRAKQEISPGAAPIYGEMVARMLAARQGRSRKCLVLDLDNTLWGGVVGDDGPEGIVLGNGNALGEAFLSVQRYARDLASRGIILAVVSKNDEVNALAPFTSHPEMVLKRNDIACFVANWEDKASNLRLVARQLAIGLDSLVFLDDNPFERNLVRQELPMVAVPEVPEDPALFADCLADAGYFEAVSLTAEDRLRSAQYQANLARASLSADASDMPGYLRGLQMRLIVRDFDPIGLPRIVQLINKTNQFNLTTRRRTEDEVREIMRNEHAFGLQLRLVDRFGDNGMIALVIGQMSYDNAVEIDTWLMSCRVLGRGVEEATLNAVVARAVTLGATKLLGTFRPTAKNDMVREHYHRLGFTEHGMDGDGSTIHRLSLEGWVPRETCIAIEGTGF